MHLASRIGDRYGRAVAAVRRRSGAVDHLWRAAERYGQVLGGRLAAATTYYGFFALFALVLLAYAALGFAVEQNATVADSVGGFLRENLPFLDITAVRQARRAVGVTGLVSLVFAGVGWVEALRSSQRLIWDVKQQPGHPVVRRLVDLAVLAGLTLLMGASVAAAAGIEWLLLSWLPATARTAATWVLNVAVNAVLAVALLVVVPRLRVSPSRLVPAVLLVVAGLLALNTVGQLYVDRIQDNAAYTVVGTAVGALVYLYLFHQVLLFAAALAATSRHGTMVDLTAA